MILGSTGLFGNPVGLLKDLGVGVMDFFYEPAQGLAQVNSRTLLQKTSDVFQRRAPKNSEQELQKALQV
jgi:hypothetical protein